MKRLVLIIAALGALMLPTVVTATKPDPDHKVGICHRTASDSNPYVYVSVDEAAVTAHLDNDHGHPAKAWKSDGVFRGVTHAAGDPKDDYLAASEDDCEDFAKPTPTPEATPSPSPEPTPVPTPSSEPSNTPSPTSEPTPSASPSLTPTPSVPTATPTPETGLVPPITETPRPTPPSTDTDGRWVSDEPDEPTRYLVLMFGVSFALTFYLMVKTLTTKRIRR